jgi:arylsulfatase A-like enzyme
VLYSDKVLATLIRQIRKTDPSAWIFFCADHPDGVGGTEGGFHVPGGRYLTEVPFLISPPRIAVSALSKLAHYPISQSDILPTILDIMGIQAKSAHDGFSLLGDFPKNRLRIVSGYMSTLTPSPVAQVIFPDKTKFHVDFQRRSVETSPGVTVPYNSLPSAALSLFEERLKEPVQAE